YEFNPKGSWYKGDAAATCIFEMEDGVVFNYTGSWCAEGFQTSWNGDWYLTFTGGGLEYILDRPPRITHPVPGDESFIRKQESRELPLTEVSPGGMGGALKEMLRFLRTGEKPQTECHDNIKSLAMVFAAMESSRRRERVTIEI
ncbi:MAG: gfo/Idh/MocA family oxidoreductase, partial [Lentisphaerae bacterium]